VKSGGEKEDRNERGGFHDKKKVHKRTEKGAGARAWGNGAPGVIGAKNFRYSE